jgi:hypothetical protein
VFLFPNLDNWPGNRNTRNTPLEGCSRRVRKVTLADKHYKFVMSASRSLSVPSAKSRILSRDEPEDVCCVALDLDRKWPVEHGEHKVTSLQDVRFTSTTAKAITLLFLQ